MSDSIYCRSALIYANFRIRWKVSWLIWSVLVMWTSLFSCCALFHNTRLVMWSAYTVFFCLSFFFVFVTFGGFVRFIWKFNKQPTNLHTHTKTAFEWSSPINAFYDFWQIMCAMFFFFICCLLWFSFVMLQKFETNFS